MKLRRLLGRIRPRTLSGEGERPMDTVDALSSAPAENLKGFDSGSGPTAPINWVPSQQDDRPPH